MDNTKVLQLISHIIFNSFCYFLLPCCTRCHYFISLLALLTAIQDYTRSLTTETTTVPNSCNKSNSILQDRVKKQVSQFTFQLQVHIHFFYLFIYFFLLLFLLLFFYIYIIFSFFWGGGGKRLRPLLFSFFLYIYLLVRPSIPMNPPEEQGVEFYNKIIKSQVQCLPRKEFYPSVNTHS